MKYDYLIHNHYDELTRSERKVADFVLSIGIKIIYATLTEVREAAGVGDATIVRFCQKLGFNGFSDFKIEIAKEDYTKQTADRPQDDYDTIVDSLVDALKRTAQLLNREQVEKAVSLMSKADQIYLFGVGGSGQSAKSLESILLRDGVCSTAITDPHIQAQYASVMKKNSLVIAFSLSGRTKDTYDAVNIAKDNGAKVIAITNYSNTPIGRQGDVVLQTAIDEFLNGGSVDGKISQLYICDVLTKGYAAQNNIDVVALRERVLRSILNKSIE
ncbi:MurR/RpiR family transcriptional regulator [Lacticaseibacillus hegangensis]|uniref:MurR/RpiR family transcriptional regulator n=1 Tax=Lacticaseibacillus hegangensis TaxID=2486010 RepID=A0ABW4CZW3_9LACO|nr:MurR/RpiR family transcriptional regulator [Lacticaseibacillus hegangensis]